MSMQKVLRDSADIDAIDQDEQCLFIKQEMPLSQAEIPLSQAQMPLSQAQMPLSQAQMPFSQAQMPFSQAETTCRSLMSRSFFTPYLVTLTKVCGSKICSGEMYQVARCRPLLSTIFLSCPYPVIRTSHTQDTSIKGIFVKKQIFFLLSHSTCSGTM